MAYASIQTGLYYPQLGLFPTAFSAAGTMANATDAFAMIGRIYIDGRPAAAKTLSTGTIQFRTGTCTFANVGTSLDIGIQGVSAVAGPIAQPNGTYTVKKTLTGGAGITTAAWNIVTMATGSASISHGDLISVVFTMTAKAGTDSVIINYGNPQTAGYGSQFPTTNAFVSSAWQTTQTAGANRLPCVVIVFDDGTVGWLDGTCPVSIAPAAETFQTATNPNERGIIFQVPFDCKVDAFQASINLAGANYDGTFKLYSNPTGTPTLITSLAFLGEQSGPNTSFPRFIATLPSEVSLSANTDYALTILATGASSLGLLAATLADTSHRVFLPGGTTLKKCTRNGSSGAFTPESPAITMYDMGVRISSVSLGGGGNSIISG